MNWKYVAVYLVDDRKHKQLYKIHISNEMDIRKI